MAVRRDAVVDRREVGLVVRAASERRDDVVYRIGAGLLADVADAGVTTQHLRS
jgi:hypothetical protein